MASSFLEDIERDQRCVHARAFLSNISLDGSHKDTMYGKLNIVTPLSQIMRAENQVKQSNFRTLENITLTIKNDVIFSKPELSPALLANDSNEEVYFKNQHPFSKGDFSTAQITPSDTERYFHFFYMQYK